MSSVPAERPDDDEAPPRRPEASFRLPPTAPLFDFRAVAPEAETEFEAERASETPRLPGRSAAPDGSPRRIVRGVGVGADANIHRAPPSRLRRAMGAFAWLSIGALATFFYLSLFDPPSPSPTSLRTVEPPSASKPVPDRFATTDREQTDASASPAEIVAVDAPVPAPRDSTDEAADRDAVDRDAVDRDVATLEPLPAIADVPLIAVEEAPGDIEADADRPDPHLLVEAILLELSVPTMSGIDPLTDRDAARIEILAASDGDPVTTTAEPTLFDPPAADDETGVGSLEGAIDAMVADFDRASEQSLHHRVLSGMRIVIDVEGPDIEAAPVILGLETTEPTQQAAGVEAASRHDAPIIVGGAELVDPEASPVIHDIGAAPPGTDILAPERDEPGLADSPVIQDVRAPEIRSTTQAPLVLIPELDAIDPESAPVIHPIKKSEPLDAVPTPSEVAPAAGVASTGQVANSVPEDLAAATRLVERGDVLVREGDIAGARLFFERGARLGSVVAMRALARTYEAEALRQYGVVGIPPDQARARFWYDRATELERARPAGTPPRQ